MTLARLRMGVLVVHVLSSVGFLGAVASFFCLAVSGLSYGEPELSQGLYAAMNLITLMVILPTCLLSSVSGLILSAVTPWGYVRHWWVIVKIAIAVSSTFALFLHLDAVSDMVPKAGSMTGEAQFGAERIQLVAASGLAVLALVTATALSIIKPRGLTRYGWARTRTAR